MATAVAKTGAIFVVDAITGLGTMPLDIDGWGLDVVIGGSQKAFMIPPGLAFMSVSPKAWKFADSASLPHYYFNLKKEKKSGEAGESSWTPSTALILALGEALQYVKQIGMAKLVENAQMLAQATRAAVSRLGLELFAPDSPGSSVTAVKAPKGMDSGVIVKEFRNRFGAVIANGQGSMKGQIFRIAHLGYFDFADLFAVIAGLEIILHAHGYPVEFGAGVAAVEKIYAEAARAASRECASGHARNPMNILIAEPLAPAGIEVFRSQPGWNTIVSSPKEYAQHLPEANALIVRSAVQVTPEVLAKAPRLRVIGRAGVGVDNVNLEAATAAGVLVMNTPGGNAISVAEHTMALMLAMARRVSQADASTRAGKWEKKKFLGSELRGKTLGIVGLGSIGREVVRRARAFEMRIMVHDPYVTSRIAADLDVSLSDLNTLYAESDYITLHVALTSETERMLSRDAFAHMKTGVRIINCARGELVDEGALADAMRSGKVAGAALDVFSAEPPPAGYPLFGLDGILTTPHIGGSTEEAQEIVGVRIAEQVAEYLRSGIAINAVNMPALSPEQYRHLGPYIEMAERLGTFAAHIASGNPRTVRFTYHGKIAENNTNLLRNAGLAGALRRSSAKKANLVNAMQIASQRGWSVAEGHEKRSGHTDTIHFELETDTGVTSRGRRRAARQSAPDSGGWHLLRGLALRSPDLHEEPGRAGRDRACRHRARPQPDQHRQFLAWPARCSRAGWRASRSHRRGVHRWPGTRRCAGAIARESRRQTGACGGPERKRRSPQPIARLKVANPMPAARSQNEPGSGTGASPRNS